MFSIVESEKLIELVKKNRCLYDPSHPQYLSGVRKRQLWLAIGKEMNMSPFECKSRWTNLRDNYRKSINRRNAGSKAGRYKYAKSLSFLKELFNMTEEDTETANSTAEDVPEVIVDTDLSPTVSNDLKNSEVQSGIDEEKIVCVEYQNAKEVFDIKYQNVNPLNEEVDPVNAYLAGIAPSLKKLSSSDLSLAKQEISQIIHKYELKFIKEVEKKKSLHKDEPRSLHHGHLSDSDDSK